MKNMKKKLIHVIYFSLKHIHSQNRRVYLPYLTIIIWKDRYWTLTSDHSLLYFELSARHNRVERSTERKMIRNLLREQARLGGHLGAFRFNFHPKLHPFRDKFRIIFPQEESEMISERTS